MKKVAFFILTSLVFSVAYAQKVYFVYLQTEDSQSFYVRMGEKIYNSTPSGYLILSNFRDSTYKINIGIQGNQAADQPFSVTVNKKDQGYLLKNFGEKGWGLFNLQTMAVVMPMANISLSSVKTEKVEGSDFTNLLAKASDDSTIKERPIIAKTEEKKSTEPPVTEKKDVIPNEKKEIQQQKAEEVKTESITTPTTEKEISNPVTDNKVNVAAGVTGVAVAEKKDVKKDSIIKKEELPQSVLDSVSAQANKGVVVTKTDSVVLSDKYVKSTVKLHSESSTTQEIGLTFLDVSPGGVTDTIKILVPVEDKKQLQAVVVPEQKEILNPIPVDSVKEVAVQPAAINKNCSQTATDDDFFKLRKKMAGENSDDDMITEAKKAFKAKCFSTRQVKNLGSLFLTDEGRYKFFDAVYAYVSDLGEFPSLQSELKEEYYINRFKAMLRQ